MKDSGIRESKMETEYNNGVKEANGKGKNMKEICKMDRDQA